MLRVTRDWWLEPGGEGGNQGLGLGSWHGPDTLLTKLVHFRFLISYEPYPINTAAHTRVGQIMAYPTPGLEGLAGVY